MMPSPALLAAGVVSVAPQQDAVVHGASDGGGEVEGEERGEEKKEGKKEERGEEKKRVVRV